MGCEGALNGEMDALDWDEAVGEIDDSKENKSARNLLDRVGHFQYKVKNAKEEKESAEQDLKENESSFKKQYKKDNNWENAPDDLLDGHSGYITAQTEACKSVAKKVASWDKTLRSSEKALAEV